MTIEATAAPASATDALWTRIRAGKTGPLAVICAIIVVIWYAGAVYLNAPLLFDKYERGKTDWTMSRLIDDAWAMDRPVLPAPHQIASELNKTVFGKKITSKRSLVFHAWVTLSSTLLGFVMGTALHKRAMGIEHFSEAARSDPKVTGDCAKIAVSVDADCEARYPRFRPAIVTLHATGGRRFTRVVDEPLGAPDNALDDAALGAKYLGLAAPVLGAARARETLAMLWRLDETDSVTGLCDALAG